MSTAHSPPPSMRFACLAGNIANSTIFSMTMWNETFWKEYAVNILIEWPTVLNVR